MKCIDRLTIAVKIFFLSSSLAYHSILLEVVPTCQTPCRSGKQSQCKVNGRVGLGQGWNVQCHPALLPKLPNRVCTLFRPDGAAGSMVSAADPRRLSGRNGTV